MTSVHNKKQVTPLRRIFDKIRYGLILQVIRNRLYRIGIEFTPFYLTRLGMAITEIPKIKGNENEYAHGFFKEEDIISIKNNARGYPVETLLDNLRKGKKCYGIKKGNEVAAFMWIDFEECNFKPIRFPLEKDEAYTYGVYTMESFRGMSIAPYMAFKCYNDLKLMGRNTIYGVSEYFNRSAVRYKMKLKPKKLKLYLYIGLFKKFHKLFILKSYS